MPILTKRQNGVTNWRDRMPEADAFVNVEGLVSRE